MVNSARDWTSSRSSDLAMDLLFFSSLFLLDKVYITQRQPVSCSIKPLPLQELFLFTDIFSSFSRTIFFVDREAHTHKHTPRCTTRRFSAMFRFYRFRQSRYGQKMKKCLPPKNYPHILVLPFLPKPLPPKKGKTVYRLKITAVFHYRSVCVRLIKRYRGNPCYNNV